MLPFRLLFLLVFAAATFTASAQPKLAADLLLGDTSQVVVLHTNRGDQLLGRVGGWSGDSLTFLLAGQHELRFHLHDLHLLEPRSNPANPDPAHEMLVLKTTYGKTFTGYLISLGPSMLRFHAKKGGVKHLRPENVASISTEPVSGRPWKGFENDYRLQFPRGRRSEGTFLGFHDNRLFFQHENGRIDTLAPSNIAKLDYRRPFRPMHGHQSSSLFAPTGFGLRKGQLAFRNIGYLFYNNFSYGLTDHLAVSGGTFGLIPHVSFKAAYDLGPYLHVSAGGHFITAISFGASAALSIGTPDYFINVAYFRNSDALFDSDLNFRAACYGASLRIGRRSRFFGEYVLISEPENEFGNFSVTNDGRRNTFTWGIGFLGRRTRLEVGMMLQGPVPFCFPGPCDNRYTPLPVISGGAFFDKKRRK